MNRRVKCGPVGRLFKSAGRWMKFDFAATRKSGGRSVAPCSRDAACWCLTGAIEKCYPTQGLKSIVRDAVLREIRETHPEDSIASWNDGKDRTFGQVRALVEKLGI